MKILFYTNIPSPYRVSFFNELGKHCELTVLFETGSSKERNSAWNEYQFDNFKGIILNGIRTRTDSSFCPQIVKFLKKNQYDHIVVTQVASITAIWTVLYLCFKRIPYCYEGDGGFAGKTKGLKAVIKRLIIGNAKYCFSTSKEFDKYCMTYGAEARNIYRYPFTSLGAKDILKKPLSKEQKLCFREELDMKEEYILLSVGQFIYRKGFDLLLEMSRSLSDNIGIYIVGGTATEEYLSFKEKWNLKQVHFVDFMKKEQLSKYYQAADVFVFPTREDIWGLVVNEAMANGLPVISTERCIAAMEMIESGENGYLIPVDNISEMKKAVETIINSRELCEKMALKALEKVAENYTIEKMAQRHMEIFKKEK